MASKIGNVIKNIKNNKWGILSLFLFVMIAIIGLQFAYAYYIDTVTESFLSTTVGDFDAGDGDINMIFYRQTNSGSYTKVYSIPTSYYYFNDSLTTCTLDCNGADSCTYSYDSSTYTMTLSSASKVTCKFYFDQSASSDIDVYILIEDSDGTYTYNSKKYSVVDNIPAYGYAYSGNYNCDYDATVSYDSDTRIFTVSTTTKNVCYAYFDSTGSSDISANVYVQSESGSTTYKSVTSIPNSKTYTLNTTKTYCYDEDGNTNDGTVTYTDGYITITASEKTTCDVYLDLAS